MIASLPMRLTMKKLAATALAAIALITEFAAAADTATLANTINAKLRQCRELPAGSPQVTQCRSELDGMMKQAMAARSAAVSAPIAAPPAPPSATGAAKPENVTVGAAMKSLPAAEQKKFQASIGAIGGTQPLDIKGMDLETAMMAVQSNRANLLEAQLKNQIASVQTKNDQIAKLNAALLSLNRVGASTARATDKLDALLAPNDYRLEKEINATLVSAGIRPFGQTKGRTLQWSPTSKGDEGMLVGGINGSVTKAQLDGAAQQIKAQIDSMSNSQQMDMLRLQSLSNKRNEAFETMTNFIKKMQDNRSAIIGNMR